MPKFASQLNLQRIPVLGFVPESGPAAPTSPAPGQLWLDTSAAPPTAQYWNGTTWIRLNGADLPDGTITNAKIASGAAIDLSKLAQNPLDRANHTGLQNAATISDFHTAVRTSRLDQMAAPTGPLSLNGQRLTSGAAPTQPTDFATKAYVDDARAGLAGVKDPVRVAAPGNINLTAPGATIDGITMATGDRFLAPAQTTGSQNGIYTWQAAAAAAVRAADADSTGEIQDGTLVAVAEGTRAGSQYIQTATPSGSPGSWTQTWTVYNTSGTSYTAGNGLQLSGNQFSVQPADASIAVSGSGVTLGLAPISKGGTGATTAAAARTALGAIGKHAADLPALVAGAWTNVVHNLGTLDVTVSVREVSSGEHIGIDPRSVDINTLAVRADVAYAAGALRVVVTG